MKTIFEHLENSLNESVFTKRDFIDMEEMSDPIQFDEEMNVLASDIIKHFNLKGKDVYSIDSENEVLDGFADESYNESGYEYIERLVKDSKKISVINTNKISGMSDVVEYLHKSGAKFLYQQTSDNALLAIYFDKKEIKKLFK